MDEVGHGDRTKRGYRDKPVRILPPEFVPITPEQAEQAIAALAALLVHAMEGQIGLRDVPAARTRLRAHVGGHERGDDGALLSPKQIAEFLGVPVQSIYAWRCKKMGPPGFRVGRHLRFRRADVEEWLRSQRA